MTWAIRRTEDLLGAHINQVDIVALVGLGTSNASQGFWGERGLAFLWLEHFLEPSFEGVKLGHPAEGVVSILVLAAVAVGAGAVGAAMAFFAYYRPPEAWRRFQAAFGKVWGWWEDGYRVDDIYGTMLVAPGRRLAEQAAFRVDLGVVDGAVNGVARLVRATGTMIRPAQSGLIRQYGLWFGLGLVAILAWLLVRGGV